MKTSCDIYKEKGDYYFQNEYYFFYMLTLLLYQLHTTWPGVKPHMSKKLG